MASLHKRKGSPYFWGSFRANGKWSYRSTGQADKKEARKVLDSWDKAERAVCSSPQQARIVIQDIMKDDLGADQGNMHTREYVTRWLESVKGTMKISSYRFYQSTLTCWLKYLGPAADQDIFALSQEQLVQWRNAEAERVTIRTVNHRLKAIRRMLAAAEDEGYVRRSPARKVATLKAPVTKYQKVGKEIVAVGRKHVRRPFTMEEIYRLDAIMTDEWKAILWMGFFTGQRLGDILTFEWSDISFPKKSLNLTTGKTGRKLWLPAPAELMARLSAWRSELPERSRFVFQAQADTVISTDGRVAKASNRFAHWLWKAGLRTNSPFGRSRQNERAAKAAKEAGEAPREHDRRKQQELSFHCLRYTARTAMEEAGVPKAVIDAFIGHDGNMGETYTEVGHDALRLAAAVLSDRAAGKTVDRIAPGTFTLTTEGDRRIRVA